MKFQKDFAVAAFVGVALLANTPQVNAQDDEDEPHTTTTRTTTTTTTTESTSTYTINSKPKAAPTYQSRQAVDREREAPEQRRGRLLAHPLAALELRAPLGRLLEVGALVVVRRARELRELRQRLLAIVVLRALVARLLLPARDLLAGDLSALLAEPIGLVVGAPEEVEDSHRGRANLTRAPTARHAPLEASR